MKGRALTTGLLIAALSVTGLAQADPGGEHHGKGHWKHHDHGDHRHWDHHDRDRWKHHDRDRWEHHDRHDWHKGGYVDSRYYRDDRYWVRDWHAHHLHRPPHGYRWLHIDGDYVLAAVATGVITAIILGH